MNPRDPRKMDVEFKPIEMDVSKFRRTPPAYMPGEYLVRLDLKSIPISEDTKKTPPHLPFGVNERFQSELSVLRRRFGLKYFAPLFADGFLHRSSEATLGPSKFNVGLWNDSKITPQLQALQTLSAGQQPSADQAKADLQYMLLKFTDEAQGESAAEYLKDRERKAACGIASLNKVPVRYIPLPQPEPEPANRPPKGGKDTNPVTLSIEKVWWSEAIGLDEAWFKRINKNSVFFNAARIAVLDTGCALEHPHLQFGKKSMVITPKSGSNVKDRTGHGTHICGILVAKEPKPKSAVSLPQGIGPDRFKLDFYKVFKDEKVDFSNSTEYRIYAESDLYLSALRKVLKNTEVHTLSISLCGTGPFSNSNEEPDVEHTLFKDLLARKTNGKQNGVNTVAAAGNGNDWLEDTEVRYPACFPEVISVGATTQHRDMNRDGARIKWEFSNQGEQYALKVGRERRAVDIYAPGAGIRSTYVGWDYSNGQEVPHLAGAQMSGTSMATPMVAAAVALLRSRKISPLSAKEVIERIDDLGENSQLRLDALLSS